MWQPEQRLIFGYEYAGEVRWADPGRVHRLLLQYTAGKLNELCAQANKLSGSKENPAETPAQPGTAEYVQGQAAVGLLAEAAFAAFGLQPVDPMTGMGATEEEAMAVLVQFMRWEQEKKTPGGTTT